MSGERHKLCKKDALGNYRPVCLTSVSGKIMDEVLVKATSRHMETMMTCNSQTRFNKDISCLINLTCLLE